MVSIPSISISSRTTTMPSQLQQHHDNSVCDDINSKSNNSIMENTVKNTHNNRQILLFNNHDPKIQQHHNETYSRRNCEDENMLIMGVENKKNDRAKSFNSNENFNRNENNENFNFSNTIDKNKNHHHDPLKQSPSKIMSSFRSKSSVLEIKSLLCASNLLYDSSSEDSSMDDKSSHLGDTESLESPYKNPSSTHATTPPCSPPGGIAMTKFSPNKRILFNGNNDIINNDRNDCNSDNKIINNDNDGAVTLVNDYHHSQRDLQFKNNDYHHHHRQQQNHVLHQENERYMDQEDSPWKRQRIMSQDNNNNSEHLILPPIRNFASNTKSDCEISNGQSIRNLHRSSSPDLNSSVDNYHSSQKSLNHLEQFAAITEAYRTSSSNSSHSEIMDNGSSSPFSTLNIRLPPASSLTNNNNHHSFENNNINNHNNNNSVQQQSLQPPPPPSSSTLLRRSSFDVPQTRYGPYTPSTLPSYMSSRLLSNVDQRRHSTGYTSAVSTSPRNDHASIEGYHHHHHHHHHHHQTTSPYGYDRGDINRHYMVSQQRSSYGGIHSPPSPNTYSVPPHHHGYSTPSHSPHHHLQMSHHPHHHHPYLDSSSSGTMVKAKRKRANANQLKVLNQVFQHTFFPSTELRIQLGKQLGMSPRTVQIWFQNKRQSWRSKSRATNNSSIKDDDGQIDDDEEKDSNNNVVNENLISRRSSNSSLSCSDEEDEPGRRSIPDSPLDNSFSRGDSYFTRNNNSKDNLFNMTSNGNVSASAQQHSYFAQSQHSNKNNNGDYYHHRRSNSGGSGSNVHVMTGSLQHINNTNNNTGVLTPTSPLPPPSSLTNQLPSPAYSTTSSPVGANERLPSFASFTHNTSPYSSPNASSNNYDPFISNRLPAPIMVNHQSSFGYQSTV